MGTNAGDSALSAGVAPDSRWAPNGFYKDRGKHWTRSPGFWKDTISSHPISLGTKKIKPNSPTTCLQCSFKLQQLASAPSDMLRTGNQILAKSEPLFSPQFSIERSEKETGRWSLFWPFLESHELSNLLQREFHLLRTNFTCNLIQIIISESWRVWNGKMSCGLHQLCSCF